MSVRSARRGASLSRDSHNADSRCSLELQPLGMDTRERGGQGRQRVLATERFTPPRWALGVRPPQHRLVERFCVSLDGTSSPVQALCYDDLRLVIIMALASHRMMHMYLAPRPGLISRGLSAHALLALLFFSVTYRGYT